VDALSKDGQEQTAKQQDPKIQLQTKEQLVTKKEQQQQRQRTHSDLPQTVKESSQQILDKKSPIKVDTPPNIDERLREPASSPPRGNKTTAEGKLTTVSLSSIAGERPPNRQSPKSRKSPQGGGGKKMKSQEQLLQQEHQKIMQQQHQQLKQQQLNRQKFQQSHLLPVGFHEIFMTSYVFYTYHPGQNICDTTKYLINSCNIVANLEPLPNARHLMFHCIPRIRLKQLQYVQHYFGGRREDKE
jgi:hypothetical protein